MKYRWITTVTILFLLLFTACGTAEPTLDMNDLGTAVAQTETAIAPILQATDTSAPTPQEEVTPEESQPTFTPEPTSTPTQTATPTPTPKPECTDLARFVSETVPDGTVFNPGQKFEKKWVLRNTGTCTWTTDYKLVFVEGDDLGEPGPVPFQTEVEPESTGEFVITFTAPDAAGEYRSDWKIESDTGEIFGLGTDATKPFFVEIAVVESAEGLDLGTPDWIDNFTSKSTAVYTGDDNLVNFSVEDGYLVMLAKQPVGDQWRMVNRPAIADFFLEATFETGPVCSAKDNYGFIIRAPGSKQGTVDSGYVFGFSCDGRFRFYRMDGGVYNGVQNWTASANLNAGTEQVNKIGILAVGDSLAVYINGARVADWTDSTYASGAFGLMIGAQNTTNLEVLMDQIAVWSVP